MFARAVIATAMLAVTIWPAGAGPKEDCEAFDRDADKSVKACTALIAKNPKDVKAYLNRAYAYDAKGDIAKGIADMDKAVSLSPLTDNADYDILDLSLCGFGDFLNQAKCVALSTRRIAVAPNDPRPYLSRARATPVGKAQLPDYAQAIRLTPDDWGIYADRARAYEKMGNVDDALRDLQKAISLKPEASFLPKEYGNIARLNLRKGDFFETILAATRSIDASEKLEAQERSDNVTAESYRMRAEAYLKLNKPDKALPDASKALELAPNDYSAFVTRGLIHEALGQRDLAIADFRSAVKNGGTADDAKAALVRLGAAP